MQIGMLETMGMDWQLLDEHVDQLKAVTPEMIQKVAKKYLTDNNLYIAELDPLPMDEQTAQRVATGGRHGG